MSLFKKIKEKFNNFELEINLGDRSTKKNSSKIDELRKERDYYKKELENEKSKSNRSLIRIWDLESKLDDVEELIMRELKK